MEVFLFKVRSKLYKIGINLFMFMFFFELYFKRQSSVSMDMSTSLNTASCGCYYYSGRSVLEYVAKIIHETLHSLLQAGVWNVGVHLKPNRCVLSRLFSEDKQCSVVKISIMLTAYLMNCISLVANDNFFSSQPSLSCTCRGLYQMFTSVVCQLEEVKIYFEPFAFLLYFAIEG